MSIPPFPPHIPERLERICTRLDRLAVNAEVVAAEFPAGRADRLADAAALRETIEWLAFIAGRSARLYVLCEPQPVRSGRAPHHGGRDAG